MGILVVFPTQWLMVCVTDGNVEIFLSKPWYDFNVLNMKSNAVTGNSAHLFPVNFEHQARDQAH